MITAPAPPQPRLAFARWQLASAVTLLFVAGLGLAPASTFALSGVAMKALCAKLPAGSGDKAAAARHKTAGDAAFAARIELASAKAAIQSYRASIAANPKQPRVLLRLSRAWYLLGDGHYRFEEDDDAQLDAFLQGGNAAAAAVALTAPRFKSLICSGAAESDAIATAKYCKIGSPIDDKATQDPCRRLFQRLLNHVLKTPAKILPKIEAEQRVEQEKAKRLLEELDTYFPKK